ncbi:MAG: DNA-directed RNA polymerase subunit beta', partial [Candidatus Paceibacterota bacterium]
MNTQHKIPRNFDSIVLKLASPERIEEWSCGEITKAETINYRTGRAERGGLFDERVFGPTKDYECYCGKYRRIRYKNLVCEKCGVEVTRSIVRRERMGHIELATPVSHIWFLRGIPSRVGLLLGLSLSDVEKVVYFAGYIITSINETERTRVLKELNAEYKTKLKLQRSEEEREKLKEMFTTTEREIKGLRIGSVLDEMVYNRYVLKYATVFKGEIGAEAIYKIFKSLDLKEYEKTTREELEVASAVLRLKLQKRLGLIVSMIQAGIRPEWMFLSRIPVMPPALRPMVALDGGRHATSDVNDLYRRVINRNNRLKKLMAITAPDVILRNEKRILQEAVDALIDNAMRRGTSQTLATGAKRDLKSISENLKGKQGLFRQNLLGKRVDYSGRSVIVVGPTMKLHQCGLPKHMALELFRPFVVSKIIEQELAYNIRGAGRLIEEGIPEVWAILEEVIKGKNVLLNRAPTLHRLGIQAFQPVLIEGNAIELHPLVCPAFNADFDGDQMAVHVPLSLEAQKEAHELMAANKNILNPGNGEPVVSSKLLDIILGCYWVTKVIDDEKGAGKIFSSPNIAITSHDFGEVGLRAPIKVMATDTDRYREIGGGNLFETTVGRLLFNSILPKEYLFLNEEIDRKTMAKIVDDMLSVYEAQEVASLLDKIKDFGFRYVTVSGITWSIDDIKTPEGKASVVAKSKEIIAEMDEQYEEGLLSADEKYRKTIEVWQKTKMDIEEMMPATLDEKGSVYDMIHSGARGQIGQITQMAGMKGLINNALGQALSFPIISSYREGLSPIEYFITTHGARYGLAATALQTAKAGYLTRRLVDVAQDIIINTEDCGDSEGKTISIKGDMSGIGISLSKVVGSRFLHKDVVSENGETLIKKGTLLGRNEIKCIEENDLSEVTVRSPLSCKLLHGICQKCYGLDLGRNKIVELGEAVGIVAAQAIGEPGTQLTMRTFHQGGVAGDDITQGLPRVEEIFERRIPKNPAIINRY